MFTQPTRRSVISRVLQSIFVYFLDTLQYKKNPHCGVSAEEKDSGAPQPHATGSTIPPPFPISSQEPSPSHLHHLDLSDDLRILTPSFQILSVKENFGSVLVTSHVSWPSCRIHHLLEASRLVALVVTWFLGILCFVSGPNPA
jgi:hypothetical protein